MNEFEQQIRRASRFAAFRTGAAPSAQLPAQLFMRSIPRYVGQKSFSFGGAAQQFDLLRIGYCEGLLLRVNLTYDIGTSGTLVARAPHTIIKNVLLQPPGAQPIVNLDGWNLAQWNYRGFDFSPFVSGGYGLWGGNSTTTPFFVNGITRGTVNDLAFPNAVTTGQTGLLWYYLPLHRSGTDLTGMLPLGNQTTTSVFITPAAGADILATGTFANVTFTIDMWQMVYTPPPARADVAPVDSSYVITYEQQVQTMTAGDNVITIDPHDTILGIAVTAINNGAQNDALVNTLTLQLDESYILNAINAGAWNQIQRMRSGFSWPRGVYMFDFDHWVDSDGAAPDLGGLAGQPSLGDWIHTEEIATIKLTPNITSVSGTSNLYTTIKRLAKVRG